jgi:hypothetical protein
MNTGSLAAAGSQALAEARPFEAAEPTAQQIARFQELAAGSSAEQDVSHYSIPTPQNTQGSRFQPLLEYAGRVSDELRSHLERPVLRVNPEAWPELYALQEAQASMRDFMRMELQFELIGKGLQLTNRNAQILYQQQG